MNKIFLLLFLFFQHARAQDITVTGTVITKNNEPLPGATIKIKGNNVSVTTGAKGKFNINASLGSTLIITHIGYKSIERNADASIPMIITMEESTLAMEEVKVSTGYQEIAKERATGSFDKIDNTSFNRSVSTDVLSRLEGIGSSLYFSKLHGTNELFIRGISTIFAGTAPLIVLDNFPYEGSLDNINPNDVESITILKDAAAASIWGAKAGNGVIVITTKKGHYGQKMQVTFNSNITVQKKPDLFYDPGFLNSKDFITVEKFLFSNGYYDGDLTNNSNRPPVSPVVELLAKVRAGQMLQQDADQKINALQSLDIRNDYEKYLYRNAVRQQYSLGLSGGDNNISYIMNAGYDDNKDVVAGNGNKRVTFYSATTIKPTKHLELNTGITYTHNDQLNNGINSVYPDNGKVVLYPYARLADDNGNPLAVEKNYRSGFTDTAGAGLLQDWKYRPLDEQRLNDNTTVSSDMLFRFAAKYDVTKHLNTAFSGQYEQANTDWRTFYSRDSYFARDMVNRYSQINGTTVKRIIPAGGILDNVSSRLSAYALRGQVNYSQRWKTSELAAIGGAEIRENHSRSQQGRTYGYDDAILTYSNVDYTSSFPLIDNLGTATIVNRTGFDDVLNRFISVYANASYTFKSKYTLSASARKDASNLFGINSNRRWTPLWSAGAAWKISDESFYKVGWLPLLKMRVTYGYSGNTRNDLSALATISYASSPNSTTNLTTSRLRNPANKDLRWERVKMINTGIDFATKNNRINGSIEYYHKNAIDLLTLTPLDRTTGVTSMTTNSANVTGKGIDIKLNSRIADGSIKLDMQLLFSYVTNTITKYNLDFTNKGGYVNFGDAITPREGIDPYALISYRFAGLDHLTGNPIGYFADTLSQNYAAIISPASWNDLVVTGTTRPPCYGNIIPVISWKGFSLSANINFKFGYNFRRTTLDYTRLFDSWVGHKDFEQRWQKPGDEAFTTVPSMVYPASYEREHFYNYSEATVEKADNIRIQDIAFSYAPAGKVFKSAVFYSYLNNIGIIWKKSKVNTDPDYGQFIPPGLSISFGVKTSF